MKRKAKKIKVKKPSKPNKNLVDRPSWLMYCIILTNRAIERSNGEQYLVDQKHRLEVEFEELTKGDKNESTNQKTAP